MSTENEEKHVSRNVGGGVTVRFIQRAGETNWRIESFEYVRLEGNPLDAIAELQPNPDGKAHVGPASAQLKYSPVITADQMGWDKESFATIDEACEFVKPRLPRFE